MRFHYIATYRTFVDMESRYLIIDRSKSYTIKKLVEKLNKSFSKRNGSSFTHTDVRKYVERGHLPVYLGGNRLVTVSDESGVEFVIVDNPDISGINKKSRNGKG